MKLKGVTLLPRRVRAVTVLTVAAGFHGFGSLGTAEEIQHLSITVPGGMPGLPLMGPIQQVSNGVSVTWFGPAGYYQLFEKPSITATSQNAAIRGNAFRRTRSPLASLLGRGRV